MPRPGKQVSIAPYRDQLNKAIAKGSRLQGEIAKRLGVSSSHLGRLLSGEAETSVIVPRLCEMYGVPLLARDVLAEPESETRRWIDRELDRMSLDQLEAVQVYIKVLKKSGKQKG